MELKIKLFADNDHLNLQSALNTWVGKSEPDILNWLFVADGAEYTYCVLVVYR